MKRAMHLDGFVGESHESEHREGVEGMAQMVEHVIASTVNDAAFEYGVIEPTVSDDLFRRPLGFVVGRAAVRTRPQETD